MHNTLINEFIPSKLMNLVSEMAKGYDVTDNNEKIDKLVPAFEENGFKHIGSGTNRIVFLHQANQNIVFKIALDERGIEDNDSEYNLSGDQFLSTFITLNHESNGLVSVADRAYTFTSDDFNDNFEAVFKILKRIADYYILDDVGPKSFLNWGYTQNNEICLLDYAYLVPVDGVNFSCRSCQGDIIYSDDYTHLVCSHCKRKYTVSDLYHEKDEKALKFKGVTVANIDEDDEFNESRSYLNSMQKQRVTTSFDEGDEWDNAFGGATSSEETDEDNITEEDDMATQRQVPSQHIPTSYSMSETLNRETLAKLEQFKIEITEQEPEPIKAPNTYVINGVTVTAEDTDSDSDEYEDETSSTELVENVDYTVVEEDEAQEETSAETEESEEAYAETTSRCEEPEEAQEETSVEEEAEEPAAMEEPPVVEAPVVEQPKQVERPQQQNQSNRPHNNNNGQYRPAPYDNNRNNQNRPNNGQNKQYDNRNNQNRPNNNGQNKPYDNRNNNQNRPNNGQNKPYDNRNNQQQQPKPQNQQPQRQSNDDNWWDW